MSAYPLNPFLCLNLKQHLLRQQLSFRSFKRVILFKYQYAILSRGIIFGLFHCTFLLLLPVFSFTLTVPLAPRFDAYIKIYSHLPVPPKKLLTFEGNGYSYNKNIFSLSLISSSSGSLIVKVLSIPNASYFEPA